MTQRVPGKFRRRGLTLVEIVEMFPTPDESAEA